MPFGSPPPARPGGGSPPTAGPTTPAARTLPRACARRFGPDPLSLATTRGISMLISLPPGTWMFRFPGLSPLPLWIRGRGAGPASGGFPHSETRGSKGACPSPRIIAACRVLHRLHVPRHPPCAHNIFPPSPGRDAASLRGAWRPPRVSHTAGHEGRRPDAMKCNLLASLEKPKKKYVC